MFGNLALGKLTCHSPIAASRRRSAFHKPAILALLRKPHRLLSSHHQGHALKALFFAYMRLNTPRLIFIFITYRNANHDV